MATSKGAMCSSNSLKVIMDIALFLSVTLPALYMFVHGEPVERGFFCGDQTLSYPYKLDTVSTPVLIITGFVISIIVVVIVEVLNCIDGNCRNSCLSFDAFLLCLKSYGAFLVGMVIQLLLVEVVKNTMGFQRPNFFDVCKPAFNTSLCPGYITSYTCTGKDIGEFRSIRQSFPSGHSSFSMYIAVYLSIHIQKRLQITFSTILKFMIQTFLIFVSVLCGLGRITDNKHHASDVIAGFGVGITVAASVYVLLVKELFIPCTIAYSNNLPLSALKCCGTDCEAPEEMEPQTPSPLLANEYLNNINIEEAPTTRVYLTKTPFFVRRHCSTPITPSSRTEDF